MFVCGIDFDSREVNMVFLCLDHDRALWERRKLDQERKLDSFERCRRVREHLPARGWWGDHGVVAVALERPMGASRIGVAQQMRVQGAILACLPRTIAVTEYAPSAWKRMSVGDGRASKDEIADWAREHWHALEEKVTQDAYDAFCIAWAVRDQVEIGVKA